MKEATKIPHGDVHIALVCRLTADCGAASPISCSPAWLPKTKWSNYRLSSYDADHPDSWHRLQERISAPKGHHMATANLNLLGDVKMSLYFYSGKSMTKYISLCNKIFQGAIVSPQLQPRTTETLDHITVSSLWNDITTIHIIVLSDYCPTDLVLQCSRDHGSVIMFTVVHDTVLWKLIAMQDNKIIAYKIMQWQDITFMLFIHILQLYSWNSVLYVGPFGI